MYKAPGGTHTNNKEEKWGGLKWKNINNRRYKKNCGERILRLVWWFQNHKNLWATFYSALATVEYVCPDNSVEYPLHEEEQIIWPVVDIYDMQARNSR